MNRKQRIKEIADVLFENSKFDDPVVLFKRH